MNERYAIQYLNYGGYRARAKTLTAKYNYDDRFNVRLEKAKRLKKLKRANLMRKANVYLGVKVGGYERLNKS